MNTIAEEALYINEIGLGDATIATMDTAERFDAMAEETCSQDLIDISNVVAVHFMVLLRYVWHIPLSMSFGTVSR